MAQCLKMKFCKKCNKTKSISEFGINSKAKDGHAYYCKSCMKAINAQRCIVPSHLDAKNEWLNMLRLLA